MSKARALQSFSLRLKPEFYKPADGFGAGELRLFLFRDPCIDSRKLLGQNAQMNRRGAGRWSAPRFSRTCYCFAHEYRVPEKQAETKVATSSPALTQATRIALQ